MAVSRTAAVILAGGRGERLGGADKAMIEIGSRRLMDRVRAALGGCEPVLVAAGRTPRAIEESLQAVPDLESGYAGPLAGVAAAVGALAETNVEWLLSVAVDTPFFPDDFLARAIALRDGVDAVVAAFGGQDYPTNTLWRLAAIHDLPLGVQTGTAPHSLKRLLAGLPHARLDYAGVVAEDPFANVNTPEDLMNLRLRESRMRRG